MSRPHYPMRHRDQEGADSIGIPLGHPGAAVWLPLTSLQAHVRRGRGGECAQEIQRSLVTAHILQNVSKISVTIFLPCLLFSEIGPLASWNNLKDCKSAQGRPLCVRHRP
jgi:hypothetical protein